MKGLFFIAAVAFIFALPQNSSSNTSGEATINEDQPANIPAEIIADWKAKGRTDVAAAHLERVKRIKPFADQIQKLLYMEHFNVGGAIIGYTEDLNSDGAGNIGGKFPGTAAMGKSTNYKSGTKMWMLEFKNYYPTPKLILEDTKGVLRDPCAWFDGSKVVFAWAKSNNGYNLYELNLSDPSTQKQLTSNPTGRNVSDFEPCYCPDSNIVFISSRCLNHVDCNFNLVSNLYTINKDGKYLRRLSFDQVNIFHPTITDQGNILYSRWEYNDRNVNDCFGVFTMNPDGTKQTEHFGNQLSWPNTFPCASWVPNGKGKFISIIGGHMGSVYQGDLVFVDPANGRNNKAAVSLIAPTGRTGGGGGMMGGVDDADRKFQYPVALDENWFLVSYCETPDASQMSPPKKKYDLYLMNQKGDRELLAWGTQTTCQPVPLGPRKIPKLARFADYSKTTGVCMMTNAYYGLGTGSKVAAGSIKKIRVVALNYRVHPWVGNTGSQAYTSTPVARFNGSWESKRVLGEMPVAADGSAAMILPARVPFYFQLLNEDGCAIQSMRSWMVLQPNEKFDCYGCHEDKNVTPPAVTNPIANVPKPLEEFYGKKDFYFYFPKLIQEDIIEKKCISCHKGSQAPDLTGTKVWTGDLTSDNDNKTAERYWLKSYLNLSEKTYVNYITIMSQAAGYAPNAVGAVKSKLISVLKSKPGGMSKADISAQDIATFAMWQDLCIPHSGDYPDDMKEEHKTKYLARLKIRQDLEAQEAKNIDDCLKAGIDGGCVKTTGVVEQKIQNFSQLSAQQFNVQCMSNGKKLVLQLPGEGDIALMDVLGRQIMTQSIGKEVANKAVTIHTKLPKGIYVVKFKGAAVTEHRIINVL